MTGRVIFLTITALPDSEAATSLDLNCLPAEHAADRVGDRARVDDRAVDDAVGRHRLDGDGADLVALAGRLELDRLDGARPDVQSHEALVSRRTAQRRLLLRLEPNRKPDTTSTVADPDDRIGLLRTELAGAQRRRCRRPNDETESELTKSASVGFPTDRRCSSPKRSGRSGRTRRPTWRGRPISSPNARSRTSG